ncbi:MAG: metal dependent phosphohydrolase, partial [Dactylosporangium sp.]|nr:metal dependent phosphohydrolase [Dactylosporangium sp.]
MQPAEIVLVFVVAIVAVLLVILLVVGLRLMGRLQEGPRTLGGAETDPAYLAEKDRHENSLASLRNAAEKAAMAVDEARVAAAAARTEAAAAKAEASAARAE